MRARPLVRKRAAALGATCLAGALQCAVGVYVPGAFPNAFAPNATLHVRASSLTSDRAELPFDFYAAPFCHPPGGPIPVSHTLGEVLAGNQLQTSPLSFSMLLDSRSEPRIDCQAKLSYSDVQFLKARIDQEYRGHYSLDGLPVTDTALGADPGEFPERVRTGFLLGSKRAEPGGGELYMLHNHFDCTVFVTRAAAVSPGGAAASHLVVGFEVAPCSIDRSVMKPLGLPSYAAEDDRTSRGSSDGAPAHLSSGLNCSSNTSPARIEPGAVVAFTHTVRFVETTVPWVNRWDAYLKPDADAGLEVFSILNSLLAALVLSCGLAFVLLRAVRRDVLSYELHLGVTEDGSGEGASGWKQLRADVFRPPPNAEVLAAAAGSGAQVCWATATTGCLAALGFMSPAMRGSALSAAVLSYLWGAGVGGYATVKALFLLYPVTGPPPGAWLTACRATAVTLPGIMAFLLAAVNLIVHAAGPHAGAVPLALFVRLLATWFFLSVPLCFAGGYAASRREPAGVPPGCTPSHIPRHVPSEDTSDTSPRGDTASLSPPPRLWLCLAGGALPFGALFALLHLSLEALWNHTPHYAVTFTLAALTLAAVLTALSSAGLTYLTLSAEEHRWWWRAALGGSSLGAYVAVYILCFALLGPLHLQGGAAWTVYLLYGVMLSLGVAAAGAALGLGGSLLFVRLLYSQLKGE